VNRLRSGRAASRPIGHPVSSELSAGNRWPVGGGLFCSCMLVVCAGCMLVVCDGCMLTVCVGCMLIVCVVCMLIVCAGCMLVVCVDVC